MSNLAIVLDAYLKDNSLDPVGLLKSLADRGAEQRLAVRNPGASFRSAPATHVFYDTATAILEWKNSVRSMDESEAAFRKCVRYIDREQTYEWLFLLKADDINPSFIERIWKLHDRLQLRVERTSLALSNVISLLAYWNEYGKPRENGKYEYIHSNLRGMLIRARIDGAQFYGVDLTQVVTEHEAAFCNTVFSACMFDHKRRVDLKAWEAASCRFINCYTVQDNGAFKSVSNS